MSTSFHSPAEQVIQRVSQRVDTDPLELPPLYHTIDPDALNAAVERMVEGEVQFQYAGESVTVHSDGSVSVTDDRTRETDQAKRAMDD